MAERVENPLSVAFNTAGFSDFGEASLKLAVLQIVQTLYYSRGEGMPDARALDRILAFACQSLQPRVVL